MSRETVVFKMIKPDGTLVQKATLRMPKNWQEMEQDVPVTYEGPPVYMTPEDGYEFKEPYLMSRVTPECVVGVRGMFSYYAKVHGLRLEIEGKEEFPPHPIL